MICGSCKKPCEVVTVDTGPSLTEFWGAVTIEREYSDNSRCCDSDELYTLAEAYERFGDSYNQLELF
jgi:hypothetical protein